MKTRDLLKQSLYGGLAVITLALMPGCESTETETEDPLVWEDVAPDSLWDQIQIQAQVSALPLEDLSQEEMDGLLFLREEEKLARDTYLMLYDLFGLRNFNNISKSEQAHMDAILYLLDKCEPGNLKRASGFHLKSFTAVLGFNGVDYEPVLLDEETYLEIIGK